ncbi:hypothetical protein [Phenylobacterium sp.]|uniref:hypothetical protein n=1 Tax=Phenylobacterium sp. TaxID=1871053 RepID=UPI00356A88EC
MKVLLSGAAAAAISGMLLGGAMQPHLAAVDDRPAGPQMFANWSGTRSTGPFDPGTTFVAYQGRVPDYVMGTDWKKAMTWPGERAAVSRPDREDEPPPEPPAAFTRAAYDAPAPVASSVAEPAPEPTAADETPAATG